MQAKHTQNQFRITTAIHRRDFEIKILCYIMHFADHTDFYANRNNIIDCSSHFNNTTGYVLVLQSRYPLAEKHEHIHKQLNVKHYIRPIDW